LVLHEEKENKKAKHAMNEVMKKLPPPVDTRHAHGS
jgi:hypothetical protein